MTGSEIRELRRRRRWTQSRLARELGTDAVTVSRWERGISTPRPAASKRLDALTLADGPRGTVSFTEDPAIRLRKLDRARRQQLDLKSRVRFPD